MILLSYTFLSWTSRQPAQPHGISDQDILAQLNSLAILYEPTNRPLMDVQEYSHVSRLTNLQARLTVLARQFERMGSMEDLNRAVEVTDMAIDATSPSHPIQPFG